VLSLWSRPQNRATLKEGLKRPDTSKGVSGYLFVGLWVAVKVRVYSSFNLLPFAFFYSPKERPATLHDVLPIYLDAKVAGLT
jgi:hypothetical protein